MRRTKQTIPEADCRAFLESAGRGVLAVHGDCGYPYAVPLNYIYDAAENCLYFHCAKQGHKRDAILRDPKVCFTVFGGDEKRGDWAWYVKSAVVFGTASIVTDEEKKNAVLRALAKKHFPPEEDTEADLARNAVRADVVKIKVAHMTGKLVHEK